MDLWSDENSNGSIGLTVSFISPQYTFTLFILGVFIESKGPITGYWRLILLGHL